jgi:hypothetical protein
LDVAPVLGGEGDRLVGVGGGADDVDPGRELRGERRADVRIVVGEEDTRLGGAGVRGPSASADLIRARRTPGGCVRGQVGRGSSASIPPLAHGRRNSRW